MGQDNRRQYCSTSNGLITEVRTKISKDMGCSCSWGCLKPYTLPQDMKLPPNIIQLHPEDTVLVEKAAACLRRAFLGTTQVPGAPIMKEAYYGVKHNDQPLDEISLNDIGLRRFNNWSMNFTLYRNLPFGGVFVYVEDDAANNNNNANHNCTVVSSVAVCIPSNNYEWDTYGNYDPSVLGLVLCPWNCSAVGIPPFSVLLDCCYESASRLKMLEKCDLEMRHRVMLNKKYWYLHALGTSPEMQRKGRASALVDVVCRLADIDGVATYIESGSQNNIQFYIKRHFQKIETIHSSPFSSSTALVRLSKRNQGSTFEGSSRQEVVAGGGTVKSSGTGHSKQTKEE